MSKVQLATMFRTILLSAKVHTILLSAEKPASVLNYDYTLFVFTDKDTSMETARLLDNVELTVTEVPMDSLPTYVHERIGLVKMGAPDYIGQRFSSHGFFIVLSHQEFRELQDANDARSKGKERST